MDSTKPGAAHAGACVQQADRPVLAPQEALAQLNGLVVGDHPLGEVLAKVADLARASIPGAEEVSVTLLEGGKAHTAAFTGRLAASLDERQYQLGFGPCIDAAQTGRTIRIDDTCAGADYPDFAGVAARQGVRSTLSVGMPMPASILGGINVYRFDEPALDGDSEQLLQTFAGYASIAVANHSLYASAVGLSNHLQKAMQSRAVIEQAKGIMMSRLRCSPEDAFRHLSTQSQRTNRKLRDVAQAVVDEVASA